MRLTFAIAVAVAACSACAEPEPGPEYWYTPEGGWKGGSAGVFAMEFPDGSVEGFVVDEGGKSKELAGVIDELKSAGLKDLAAAYQALYEALQAQVMVRNLSNRLNEFLGQERTYRITQGKTSFDVTIPPWNGDSQQTEVQSATAKGMPILDGDGKSIIKLGDTLSIQNWNNPSTGWTLASQLVKTYVDGSARLEVLARIPGGSGLAYIPIGMGIGGGGVMDLDLLTVSTNAATGKVELKNWSEMGVERAEDCAIPYSDNAEEGLKWGRFGGFFDSRQFDFNRDGSGVVRLEGWQDDLEPGRYFGTGGEAGTYGFFKIPLPDEGSVVTNAENHVGEIALAGFWDEGTEDGMVPMKDGDSISWGKVGVGVPDECSVVTNAENHIGEIALAGFWDDGTTDGMVPMKSGNSLAWVNVGSAIKVIGTDESEAVVGTGAVTNTLEFAYLSDSSNVVVTVEGDGSGNAVIKIGAYWR